MSPPDPSADNRPHGRAGIFTGRFSGHSRIDILVLASGILFQIARRFLTFRLGFDDVCAISAGHCFANGGPIGYFGVSASDLSQLHREILSHWPPGYSVFIAFLLKLTHNLYVSAVGSELIGLAVFGVGLYLLLDRLRDVIPPMGRLFVALVSGWWGPPFLGAYHTNLWSLALFFVAVGLLVPPYGLEDPAPGSLFSAGLLLGMTITLRYAYAPISVVPIGVTILLLYSRPSFWTRAASLVAGWAAVMAIFVYWKVIYAGNPHFGRGDYAGVLHFASLSKFYPFGADAIFGHRLVNLFPLSSYSFSRGVNAAQFGLRHIFSVIILASAAGGAAWCVRSAPPGPASRAASIFFMIGLATVVADVSFLSYMTLVSEPWDKMGRWVYANESRYFSVCLPFILFGAAAAATAPRGFGSMLAKIGCQIAFGFSALAWLVSLPAQGRALRRFEIGGPIDRYLFDRGAFLGVVRNATKEPGPLVIVEIGHDAMTAGFRRVQGMLVDVPGVLIKPGDQVATSHPLRALFVANPKQGSDVQSAFTDMCKQTGATPFAVNDLAYCTASVFPSPPQGSPSRDHE